jgi:DNA modification methylase
MNVIVGGHMRVRAAQALGYKQVPCVYVSLEEPQERELNLRLNRNLGEWDWDLLAEFDVPVLRDVGFTDEELVKHFDIDDGTGSSATDTLPDEPAPERVKPGEVWALGDHRVICGDSTDAPTLAKLLGDLRIDFVVTSPPYNADVAYDEHDDKMTREDYLKLVSGVVGTFMPMMKPGRAIAWNIGVTPKSAYHRHACVIEDCGGTFVRNLVWRKAGIAIPLASGHDHKVRGIAPNYVHEMVMVFANGPKLEQGGSVHLGDVMRDDVFTIASSVATRDVPTVSPTKGGLKRNRIKAHPAMFPVQLPREFVRLFSEPGEVVYDPFSGAGTTLLACEESARVFRGVELSPRYVDLTLLRWERITGKRAVLLGAPGGKAKAAAATS